MPHISVIPPVIEFNNVQAGNVYTTQVQVKNLDTTGPRSLRIKAPVTQGFSVKGSDHTERIAPGLAVTFEVTLDTHKLQSVGCDLHDCIKITSAAEVVNLWVHAFAPKAELHVEGDLHFGAVGIDTKPIKQLQLLNKGLLPAQYTVQWDKSLPLAVRPAAGVLEPTGQEGSIAVVTVQLTSTDLGALAGELIMAVAGAAQPFRMPINANVVQQSYEFVDTSNVPVKEIDFGRLFFGEASTRTIALFNNGPAEARFDVSYGTAADMKAIAGAEEDAPAAGTGADLHATFLQVARIRAKAREDKDVVLKITPVTGTVPPYSTVQLQVTFKPIAPAASKGFTTQPLSSQQQSQVFDCLMKVNLAGGSKNLRLPVKGRGLAPLFTVNPRLLHFGMVAAYEWADQEVQVSNDSSELPMQVAVDRSGPYFQAEPAQLQLAAGERRVVLMRYMPKALGRHQASMSFQVVSSRAPSRPLVETVVQVQGSSLSLGKRGPLPGGLDARPDTFKKPRAMVDESEAAVAHLTASKTFIRPHTWETLENAFSLVGIGPQDKFGVTKDVQVAKTIHADRYTSFIRAGRTAAERKYLTAPEGDTTDMGMKPYRGLSPTKLRLPQLVDPLWTVNNNSAPGRATQRAPSPAVLSGIPTYKEWPETAQERSECSAELSMTQLSKVTLGPKVINFGRVSCALVATQYFVVTNPLKTAIHVVLDLQGLEEITCAGPAAQVIPSGATAKFQLVLLCHDVTSLRHKVQYCINGCHMQSVEVAAEVVAATLELSLDELLFSFSLDNWEDYVEQSLTMENYHPFAVDYEWAVSSPVFSIRPAAGTVKPKGSCQVTVRWTPSYVSARPKSPQQARPGSNASNAGAASLPSSKGSKKPASNGVSAADFKQSATTANSSTITIELPGAATAAAAAAAVVGCQQTGFMTLRLKGGADAAPKKVMLHGELPAGLLKFKEKEVNLGPVPVYQQQTAVVQLRNAGSDASSFRVVPQSGLTVTPDRSHVSPESVTDLEVVLLPQPGQFAATLELEVRGGKPLKLPIKAEGIWPSVHVSEGAIKFPDTFIASTSQVPLTLVNTTPVPATLLCDFTQYPEFELLLSREAWAAAGFSACPVQKIGANGEMSTVGSKRVSRRMTSQGGRKLQGSNYGDCGYKFLIQLKASSSLPLQLMFRPSRAQSHQFALPLVLHGSAANIGAATAAEKAPVATAGRQRPVVQTSGKLAAGPGSAASSNKPSTAGTDQGPDEAAATLAVPVAATGAVPQLIVSLNVVNFGSKVVLRPQQANKSPYSQDLYVRNNTEADIRLSVGAPSTAKDPASHSTFTLEGLAVPAGFVTLPPDEGIGFTVRFSPTEARNYEATIPVYTNEDKSTAYLQLALAGVGTLPSLQFDVPECLLPVVPLNVTSHSRLFIVNSGYDNLELSVRLPHDTSHAPVSLSFPEGNLIGLAKDRLPVDVSFSSSRPLSFTAMVDFLAEDGRAFSIAVTGTADNCSLTHQPFMQVNQDKLKLAEGSAPGGPLQLLDKPDYVMPLDEIIGPLHLTEGLCKCLSATTSRNWGSTSSSQPTSNNSSTDTVACDASANDNVDVSEGLRKAFRSSKGKQLQELVTLLSGKPINLKGVGSRPCPNKTEAAQQLLAVYDLILHHLIAHGALLNAVRPEYLLDKRDFMHVMEARTAAAAGNSEQEEGLEHWEAVQQEFWKYSTQAWNSVLLQVFKVFVLKRVTPAAVRQLLQTTHTAAEASNSIENLHSNNSTMSSQPTAETATSAAAAKQRQPAHSAAAPNSGIGQKQPATVLEDAAAAASLPADEVLASSNIFSAAEASLLAWMNARLAQAFPQVGRCVTNFGNDMHDGLVLGALLAAYWPANTAGSLLAKLHHSPKDARKLKENQALVMKAWQELCLPYELAVADLEEAEPANMLFLVVYLFLTLPQLLPRATLDFKCKLSEQQVQDIQLTNPTRRPLSYSARLEGHADFSLEASVVKIEPGQSMQVPVCFSPSSALPKTSRLVFMSRRDGSSASAVTLVFLLRGQVDSRSPLKQVVVQAPLYQFVTSDFSITNPFSADCDFTISIIPKGPDAGSTVDADNLGKKSNKGGSSLIKSGSTPAAGKKAKQEQLQQQMALTALFPDPFGLDRHRLRLRAGASDKLKLSFLPFQMPPLQQPAEPAVHGKPAVPKGVTSSLLVLTDSECGEFVYELCGEVLMPAIFMEHKAVVGLGGQQVVELRLPFTNHLLEGARRVYAERHPLAKDKEQAAKLRSNIGKLSDKGEVQLDYIVTCSNSLISCPTSVVLKGLPVLSHSMAGSTASAAAGGGGGGGHHASEPSKDNVMTLGLRPSGTGIYPVKLTLTSPYDVRVIHMEVTAQSMGQTSVLELECPARQQVLQDIPLVNTGETPFSAVATLSGKGYTGPREVPVPAKSTVNYPLAFCPPGSGTYSGTLEIFIAATGEKNVYTLVGKAGEPLAEGHIVVDCQARSSTMKRIQVPNVTNTVPLQYSVYADLDCLSGPATHTCNSATRGDSYKLAVLPLKSGTLWGSISFVTADGQYCWYSVEVHASEPPDMGLIQVSSPIRQAVAIQVTLTNPSDKPLQLRSHYSTQAIVGPASFVAPPGQPCVFECYYAPLLVGREDGRLRLVSEEAGEFWWRVQMEATPGGPIQLPFFTAQLGCTATHTLTISNPTAAEAHFSASSSNTPRFAVKPSSFSVAAGANMDVVLEYTPGSVGQQEEGSVSFSSNTAGTVEYICRGQGEMPAAAESATVRSALDNTSSDKSLSWTNPFSEAATVQVKLSSSEPPGTFSLNLFGTKAAHQPQKQQQQQLGSASTGQPIIVQQIADNITVQPQATLQLAFSFCPALLKVATAELSVLLVSPAVNAPAPLVWRYQLQGQAYADPQGVRFAIKCKAKRRVEEVITVPLPGLDPAVLTAAAAAAEAAAFGLLGSCASAVRFSHELIVQPEHRAAMGNAVSVHQVNQVPVPASSVGAGDAAYVLQYKLCFSPQKAVAAQAQLAVSCSTGAYWLYDLHLLATAPEFEGVLTLEAHMGCTAELPLYVYSSGTEPQPFTAEFTTESPLNFNVVPAKGMLPPAPADDSQQDPAAAPMKVTFLCKELGKVMTGKLMVITPDSQHTFVVKGKQPAYVPPSRSQLPSGTYLTAGTASSMARGSPSNSSVPVTLGDSHGNLPGPGMLTGSNTYSLKGSIGPDSRAGQLGGSSIFVQQGSPGKVNYLQRNIKAAKDHAAAAGNKTVASSSKRHSTGSSTSKGPTPKGLQSWG